MLVPSGLRQLFLVSCLASALGAGCGVPESPFDPLEKSAVDIQCALEAGSITSVKLVQWYLARIKAYDPALNAVAELNPFALAEARALDEERSRSITRGPLHGIPILVKDNYETVGMTTSAGSAILEGFSPVRDATLVARLKAQGCVLLGKANMHEFALYITTVGSRFGATRSPYDRTVHPGGSSGGSAVAAAANFASFTMGSDTCGSLRIPAAFNGLVSLRGTMGASSRHGIIPLAPSWDVGGPMARDVTTLALALDAIVGDDPLDSVTLDPGRNTSSFASALKVGALQGARIGVLRNFVRVDAVLDDEFGAIFDQAMRELALRGAKVVDVQLPDALVANVDYGWVVLTYEFKEALNRYLAANPDAGVASLAEAIASGKALSAWTVSELMGFSEVVNITAGSPDSLLVAEWLAKGLALRQGLASLMDELGVDALAYPTNRRRASKVDPVTLDHNAGDEDLTSNCHWSADTGMPAITVVAGATAGSPGSPSMPVGFDLLGRRWSDQLLVAFAYDFEQAYPHRFQPRMLAAGDQKCPNDQYHSPNKMICVPNKKSGESCNAVQRCASGLYCVATRCSTLSKPELAGCSTVVVGGGFAGMYAAFLLNKQGKGAETCLFEAQDYLGGRLEDYDHLDGWQALGGIRVDRSHLEVIALAKELGITLERKDHTGMRTFSRGRNATDSDTLRDAAFPVVTESGKTESDLYDIALSDDNMETASRYTSMRDYLTSLPGIGTEGFEFMKSMFRFRADWNAEPVSYLEFLLEDFNTVGEADFPEGGLSSFIREMQKIVEAGGVRLFVSQPVTSIGITTNENEKYMVETSAYHVLCKNVILAVPPTGTDKQGQPLGLGEITGVVPSKIREFEQYQALWPVPVMVVAQRWNEDWWTGLADTSRSTTTHHCNNHVELSVADYPNTRKFTRTVYSDAPECVSTWEALQYNSSAQALEETVSRGLAGMYKFPGPVPVPRITRSRFWTNAWHFHKPGSHVSMPTVMEWAKNPSPELPGLAIASEAYHIKHAWVQGALESAGAAVEALTGVAPPKVPSTRSAHGNARDKLRRGYGRS